jgi:hypothetical protein
MDNSNLITYFITYNNTIKKNLISYLRLLIFYSIIKNMLIIDQLVQHKQHQHHEQQNKQL